MGGQIVPRGTIWMCKMQITGERYSYRAKVELKTFQRFLINEALNGSNRDCRYTPFRRQWDLDNISVEFDVPIAVIRNYVNGHISFRELVRRCEFTFWSEEHNDWEGIEFDFIGESVL